ncbi:MAG: N-acetyl-gamma-glutamyl-phosphate reductase [Lachnospiraceae bacterium]|nr:N-acetyl-gamma-glutamyl-phosphate reductase [Lachnospiraceae bacterium]
MIRAGIIGSTGYAGAEIARLLANREDVEIIHYGSRSYAGKPFVSEYGNLRGFTEENCGEDDIEALSEKADVIFTATPQGYLAKALSQQLLDRCRFIDLSADFRLRDPAVYEQWYKLEAAPEELLSKAVYGLCELYREDIKKTRLVANPGCYTTCSILTIQPLLKSGVIKTSSIIIDAKSGVSGAGRGGKVANLFCEVNESVKAYGVGTHRHTPEIEQELSIAAGEKIILNFTPHLIPMQRGILITAYAELADREKLPSWEELEEIYQAAYGQEPFIRLLPKGVCPETRFVEGSNFLDINFVVDERTGRVIMMGALDNLVKGAAGQAVQNMNLLFGIPETKGLLSPAMFP